MVRRIALALIAFAVVGVGLRSAAEDPERDAPRDLGLVERATSRLAQLDVSVSGPEDVIERLEAGDFDVVVGGKRLTGFLLDRVCREGSPAAATPRPTEPAPPVDATPVPRPAPPTYLFYFDQPHLTLAGRQGAIDIARDLVPRLIRDGARGMVVSNGRELVTHATLTDDPAALLAALRELEADRERQWDPYGALEENRLTEIANLLGEDSESGSTDLALSLARRYQVEERWRQEKDLRRFGMVLGRFAEIGPPKAVMYFSDTMRGNAGEHYLSFFGKSVLESDGKVTGVAASFDAATGELTLDRVINAAAAHGIRFYTVEGQGLAAPSVMTSARSSAASLTNAATPTLNSQRIRDAQGTLVSMAAETGGKAFLNGVAGSKIARRVLDDLACLYLISFDPSGFPEDEPLPVKVTVGKPRVRVQVRGRIVIPGESSRLTSRLLAAFAAPEAVASDLPIHAALIPTGFRDGDFTALVQVVVAGSLLPEASWDLGASLVSSGKVFDDISGRIAVRAPGVPVVLEREMRFSPGPFEIVAVAHDTVSDQLASERREGRWQDPEESLAMVGPIAVLQRTPGAFLRDDQIRTAGTLARAEDEPVRAELPTAIMGIVCRSKNQKGTLRVERRLVGETEAPFPELELQLGSDRCAPYLDKIPENTLGPGEFRYEIRVFHKDLEVARRERYFTALEPSS